MKLATKTLLACTVSAAFVTAANAATIEQIVSFSDGNSGGANSYSFAFDVVNTNSILVAAVYVDSGDSSLASATFGGVAADATVTNGRLTSMLFVNPSSDSGLEFAFDPSAGGNPGAGAIIYELSGVDTSLSSITTVTGSNSIITTTADELIVSFAGRNGASSLTVNGGSIFGDEDISSVGPVKGGGAISSASAIAGTIGSQNITWNSASDGRVAYAFEAAPTAIPEPASLAVGLIGLGGLALRRRRGA